MSLKPGPPTSRAAELKRRLGTGRGDDELRGTQRAEGRLWSRLVSLSVVARAAVVVAIAVAAALLVWREVDDTSAYLEPINVPAALDEHGLTSVVLTRQVVDRIGEIVREMGDPYDALELRVTTEVPEFRIVTFGPSMQSIGREIRRATGRTERRISGAVVRDDTGWHVTMRNSATHLASTAAVVHDDRWQSRLVDAAALGVLRLTNAELLMEYQYSVYNRTLDPSALDPLEATVEFRERVAGERADPYVRHIRALVSFERGDFDRAQSLWLRLAQDYPDRPRYKSLAAMAARVAGRVDEANALLTAIVQANQSRSRQVMHASSELIALGRASDALTLCLQSLRADPTNFYPRLVAARALNELHRPAEAVAVLGTWTPKSRKASPPAAIHSPRRTRNRVTSSASVKYWC